MQFRLRTLMALTAVGPPIIALIWAIVTDFEVLVTFSALLLVIVIIVLVVAGMLGTFG
jgi:hypothetical protein